MTLRPKYLQHMFEISSYVRIGEFQLKITKFTRHTHTPPPTPHPRWNGMLPRLLISTHSSDGDFTYLLTYSAALWWNFNNTFSRFDMRQTCIAISDMTQRRRNRCAETTGQKYLFAPSSSPAIIGYEKFIGIWLQESSPEESNMHQNSWRPGFAPDTTGELWWVGGLPSLPKNPTSAHPFWLPARFAPPPNVDFVQTPLIWP